MHVHSLSLKAHIHFLWGIHREVAIGGVCGGEACRALGVPVDHLTGSTGEASPEDDGQAS